MKALLIALAVVLGAAAIYVVIDILIVTDKERIENMVEVVSRAIEREDLEACMKYVSDDFIYEERRVDKRRLARYARHILDEADNIVVDITELEITVEGEEADVFIAFRILGEYVGRMERFVGTKGFILGEPLKAAKANLRLCKRSLPDAPDEAQWMLCSMRGFHPGYSPMAPAKSGQDKTE